ncbi:hypothetical protein IFM89_030425 [Coptis chinensis]|uniref:Uncharacterized protein n=1 Tax=Coptis chinensis TaxID=261450 RepID=A0A835HWH2_9MAGN|nr:hypothetical protein IFM89_030425 [Coptis chinensis]
MIRLPLELGNRGENQQDKMVPNKTTVPCFFSLLMIKQLNLGRILRLLTSLKVVSVLPPPDRDPTPLSLLPFGRLKVLELRGCDLSTSPAKGLLQLRHTLEKLILHNSTLLMDDSLQLLPNVESRNRFGKRDNLKKCAKLSYLDLGFNHLRSISSLSEVACSIVKLVFLEQCSTSLNGIETLKSIEGLDLSYNVISNVSSWRSSLASHFFKVCGWKETPFVVPHGTGKVFSLFAHPEKLKLGERGITTRKSWKRQTVIASKLKRPAGFGFYCPAIDNDEDEGTLTETGRRSILSEAVEQDSVLIAKVKSAEEEKCRFDSEAPKRGMKNVEVSPTPVTAIDEMMESHHLSSSYPRVSSALPGGYTTPPLQLRGRIYAALRWNLIHWHHRYSDTSNSDDEYLI